MIQRSSRWSGTDDQKLIDYVNRNIEQGLPKYYVDHKLSDELGRTDIAVRGRIQTLIKKGMIKNNACRKTDRWNKEEDEILIKKMVVYDEDRFAEMTQYLDRSEKSIRSRSYRLLSEGKLKASGHSAKRMLTGRLKKNHSQLLAEYYRRMGSSGIGLITATRSISLPLHFLKTFRMIVGSDIPRTDDLDMKACLDYVGRRPSTSDSELLQILGRWSDANITMKDILNFRLLLYIAGKDGYREEFKSFRPLRLYVRQSKLVDQGQAVDVTITKDNLDDELGIVPSKDISGKLVYLKFPDPCDVKSGFYSLVEEYESDSMVFDSSWTDFQDKVILKRETNDQEMAISFGKTIEQICSRRRYLELGKPDVAVVKDVYTEEFKD